MFSATFDFHRTVVAAANSPRLRTVLRLVTNIVPGKFFALVPGAATAYAETMRKVGDLVVSLFRVKGMFDAAA